MIFVSVSPKYRWEACGVMLAFFALILFGCVWEAVFGHGAFSHYALLIVVIVFLARAIWRIKDILRWWRSLDPRKRKPRRVPPEDQWLAETTKDPDWR